MADNFQFWGYNPPFTLPHFRRNEVWVKLNYEQVSYLKEKYPFTGEGRLVGGSSSSPMKGRTVFAVGACGLLASVYVVGLLFKRGTQYRRI